MTTPAAQIVRVENVTKKYNDFTAVDDIRNVLIG